MGLTLTRSSGECITIRTGAGEVIQIKYLDRTRNTCRLVFDAPQSCVITRTELLEAERQDEPGHDAPAVQEH